MSDKRPNKKDRSDEELQEFANKIMDAYHVMALIAVKFDVSIREVFENLLNCQSMIILKKCREWDDVPPTNILRACTVKEASILLQSVIRETDGQEELQKLLLKAKEKFGKSD